MIHRPRAVDCLSFVSGAALFLLVAAAPPLYAQPSQRAERLPIRYTVRVAAPKTHYVEVDAVVPTDGRPTVELMMAVWTPGSYLVREYERHVESLQAHRPDGQALIVEKTRKNRWRIENASGATVIVRYRVFCHELTARNNWVEDGFAVLNGAPTFVTLVGGTDRPHEVRLILPDS